MNNTEISKSPTKTPQYQLLINFIRSRSRDTDGKINIIGKTSAGLIGSLILMFFFMLGYSFLYGIYFGNGRQSISILDIGLNIVPIDTKFIISIGILILILTCIFVIPIRDIFFKENLKIKLINLFFTVLFGIASIYIFKIVLIGNLTFKLDDIYLIAIPISIPLIVFSCAYIGEFYSDKKSIAIVLASIVIIIIIDIIIIIILRRINQDIATLLVVCFMPMVSAMSYLIKYILLRSKTNNQEIIDRSSKEKQGNKINPDSYKILVVSMICIIAITIVSIPNFFATLGSFYGQNYVSNSKQIITYVQNNEEKQKVGEVVGCKDGNYYISEYPNKNLVIIRSTQVVVDIFTGWQKSNSKWYYFDADGVMKTGWIEDNGKNYCLYSNGEMIYGCDIYGYRFASDGVATKLS